MFHPNIGKSELMGTYIEDILKKRETTMAFKALTARLPLCIQDIFNKSENSKLALPI